MKKYIIGLIAAAMVTCSGQVMAQGASFSVEGENYDYATFDVPLYSSGQFSGGKFVNILESPKADEYKIVYTIEAPKEGSYSFRVRCSQINETYSTDFFFSINNGEYVNANSSIRKKVADFPNSVYGDTLIKEYTLGEYDLKEGKNTVTILVNKDDIRNLLDGKLCFILDYFSFTLLDGEIKDVTPSKNCGVYERDDIVRYAVTKVVSADADCNYTYVINDFWGRNVEKGSFVIAKGTRTKNLSLGKFGLGWYEMKIYKEGEAESVGYAYFSVTPNLSERVKGDTPFAVDSGSGVLLKDDSIAEDFQRTLPLAGIKWARERASADVFSATGYDNYDDNFTNRFDLIKKNGVKTTQILVTSHLKWGSTAFTDLFRAYDFHKELIKNTEDKIDLMEIDNEQDGSSAGVPADMFAAYTKAMYLANVDSGTDMKMSMVSLCLDPDRTFTDGILKNEIMNWTDIFNFHAHTTPSRNKIDGIRQAFLDDYYETKMRYSDIDMPNWLTEAGIFMPLKDGAEDLDIEQQREQAQYLTTATVEGIAEGVDKFFWFIWVKYNENGSDLSSFDTNYNPYAAVQAQAICSYVLGEGKYIGEDCNENANTYMFDNGKNDVMVLWTDAPKKYDIKTDKKVIVTDLVGQTQEMYPVNGVVSVDIAYYPVYVTFDGKADLANYYPREYKQEEVGEKNFSDAERIILQQTFNQDLLTAKNKGYLLVNNATEKMTLTVNNFNNESKDVKLVAKIDNCEVKLEKDMVTVPAMSKVQVAVELTPRMDGKFDGIEDYKGYLTFKAIVDDKESSPSVSTIRIGNDIDVKPDFLVEGSEDITNFNIHNVMEGADVSSNVAEDGSYQFHVQLNADAGWYYPRIDVKDTSRLENSDGLVFEIKADENTVGKGDFKCFLNLSDGRRYYSGSEAKFECKGDWVQVKMPWEDLILFTSPLGAFDIRSFDPTLVESLEIGCNLYPGSKDIARKMSFFLKDAGYFIYETEAKAESGIIINGIESNKKYNPGELGMITVDLPEGSTDVSVMLTDDTYDKYTLDGNKLTVDLSGLTRGKHTLRVKIKNNLDMRDSNKVDFYIN